MRNFYKKFRFLLFQSKLFPAECRCHRQIIENALGKAVPVLIGFLAYLLGIGFEERMTNYYTSRKSKDVLDFS